MLETEPNAEKMRVETLLATARDARRRAAAQYVELAQLHGGHANREASDAFHVLAMEEAELAEKIGDAPAITIRAGEYPALFDNRDADRSRSSALHGYDVHAMAIRSCERMFDFWSYVSAHAQNDAVKRMAEEFAHEELRIASRRRTRRRAAFRVMQEEKSVALQKVSVVEAEMRLDHLLTEQIRNHDDDALRAAQDLSHVIRQSLDQAERYCAMMPDRIFKNAFSLSEYLADFYVAAIGVSGNKEATALLAQVSTLALRRLALLRNHVH